MNIKKSIWVALVTVSVCLAQTYNISGIVTDTGTTPISGAVVRLEKAGLTATSGTDGRFSLTGTVGIHGYTGGQAIQGPVVALQGGLLRLDLREPAVVRVDVYSVQGRRLSTIQRTLGSGTSTLLCDPIQAGVCLYRAKIGPNEVVLKGTAFSGKTGVGLQVVRVSGNKSEALTTTSVINDVIAVTKEGLLNYRVVVYNSDTGNIQIKMIANAGNLTDIDGNVYQAVRIGNQVWMAENLRVTRYNDGSVIPLVTDSAAWRYIYDSSLANPAYCYYNNTTNVDSIKKFGALYNWYVASSLNPQKIAFVGWHVPNASDWLALVNFLDTNGYNWDDTTQFNSQYEISKSIVTMTDWNSSLKFSAPGLNLPLNNKSGFSGPPGGDRSYTSEFQSIGEVGTWWTSSDSRQSSDNYNFIYVTYSSPVLLRGGCNFNYGKSIRLVKD